METGKTSFVVSPDGVRIACDVQGEGFPLLLVHGFTNNRQSWHDHGWVARLQSAYRVITLDMRGRGESDKPVTPDAYRVERLLDDILAVADANGAEKFSLIAHSWGGSAGLHLAARSTRVQRAVIAGTCFGPIFTRESIDEQKRFFEELATLKAENRLHELPEVTRSFAEKADFPVLLASNEGLRHWPGVEPQELLCPTLLYLGALADQLAGPMRQRQGEIEAAGVKLVFFEGLDHSQEITAIETVLPTVLNFLKGRE